MGGTLSKQLPSSLGIGSSLRALGTLVGYGGERGTDDTDADVDYCNFWFDDRTSTLTLVLHEWAAGYKGGDQFLAYLQDLTKTGSKYVGAQVLVLRLRPSEYERYSAAAYAAGFKHTTFRVQL